MMSSVKSLNFKKLYHLPSQKVKHARRTPIDFYLTFFLTESEMISWL